MASITRRGRCRYPAELLNAEKGRLDQGIHSNSVRHPAPVESYFRPVLETGMRPPSGHKLRGIARWPKWL